MSEYKAIELSRHSVIVKNNKICTDRDIKTKNSFTLKEETQKVCDDLNEWEFKTIITDTEALRVK